MPITISELMSRMPGALLQDKAAGVDAVIQFIFTGAEAGNWYVTIKEGKCSVAQGDAPSPKMTLTADSSDYIRIITGELDRMKAFMEGRIKLGGDLALAMKLMQMFKVQ